MGELLDLWFNQVRRSKAPSMELIIALLVAGAVLGLALRLLKGAVSLFVPRRSAANFSRQFDAAVRALFRWIGRAVIIYSIGLAAVVWWIVAHEPATQDGPSPPTQIAR